MSLNTLVKERLAAIGQMTVTEAPQPHSSKVLSDELLAKIRAGREENSEEFLSESEREAAEIVEGLRQEKKLLPGWVLGVVVAVVMLSSIWLHANLTLAPLWEINPGAAGVIDAQAASTLVSVQNGVITPDPAGVPLSELTIRGVDVAGTIPGLSSAGMAFNLAVVALLVVFSLQFARRLPVVTSVASVIALGTVHGFQALIQSLPYALDPQQELVRGLPINTTPYTVLFGMTVLAAVVSGSLAAIKWGPYIVNRFQEWREARLDKKARDLHERMRAANIPSSAH